MSDITIITNSVPREILEGWEIPADVRVQFAYVDWDAVDRGDDSASFFRYKGEWYDLGDIPAVYPVRNLSHGSPFAGWDGVASDSFFSGILVRYCDDHESIVVGRYYC
jgi:hypothetical protein